MQKTHLYLLNLIALLGLARAHAEHQTTQHQVTIWVHGTMLIKPIKKFHAAPPGLQPIEALPSSYHLKKTVTTLCQKDPEHFDFKHFYAFGWSGKLSPTEREHAANNLYQEIQNIRADYKKNHGHYPRLRIITHSHGGNVTLNLAKICGHHDALCVDELILLACPVQNATKNLITAPCFKKIYAVYSDFDLMQVLDPQGIHPKTEKADRKDKTFFSQRHFPDQDNLIQVRIKLKGRSPFHAEFVMSHFIEKLPSILSEAETKAGQAGKPLLIRR